MTIYTYCSYKGSKSGYKYVNYNKKESETQDRIYSKTREWFENKDGWFLMLGKEGPEGGLLALSSLERIVNYENAKRCKRQEEIQAANNYRSKKLPYNTPDLQALEVIWYLNFAIYDKVDRLYRIALGIIEELRRDNGMAFYARLIECFTMSEEKEDYAFDEKKLADLLNELQRNIKLKEPDNIHAKATEPDNMMQSFKRQNLAADILRKYLKKNILNVYNKEDKAYFYPDLVRQSTSRKEKLDLTMYNPADFSDRNMIIIMNNDNLSQFGRFNIALSFDWVMGE